MLVRLRSRHVALPTGIVERLMGRSDVGGMELRGARESLHCCVIAHDEIEHAGEESRVGRGVTQGLRTDAGFGQEQAQPLGIAGDEGKCLNCNDFSYFPGVVNRLSQLKGLPFR